jgi:protein-tyrosine kinase
MSLVEKALRKIQGGATLQSEAAPRTIPLPGKLPDGEQPVPARALAINHSALQVAGLLPPKHMEREIALQYRQIKRPLIDAAIGRGAERSPNAHLVMVSSAMPGEGKTFTSLNLALSLSLERDVRVLLVDADLAKPHISRLLGVADAPGLLDVLRDPKLDVERVILPTNIPRLAVLPAGTHSEDATELLASARMQEVVKAIGLRDANRMAIFDSPPLLLTTESRALAQVAGQVVMVVYAGVTSQQVVLDALTYIGAGPQVSLILNQSRATPQAGYYYHSSAPSSEAGSS